LGSALFWNIMQRRAVIPCRRFGVYKFSRNVCMELPLFYAALHPRRGKISFRSRQKPETKHNARLFLVTKNHSKHSALKNL